VDVIGARPAAAVALALLLFPRPASAAGLRTFDFMAFLRTQVADVCGDVEQPTGVTTLEFADVDGDGEEEAILVGWDCMTGTAGPNIHSVYKAGLDGQPVRLHVERRGKEPPRLAGNANYSLHARNGELVRAYTDSSGRDHPWTEVLRWNGSQFAVVRVEKPPTYRTSFDCAAASTAAEITICGDEELAALDRELGKAFAAARAKAAGEKRQALAAAQRAWLEARDRNCSYKMIPECVREAYRKRLAELSAPGGSPPPARDEAR
jgi:uncharacterized protein YecT (DUF1311 family)